MINYEYNGIMTSPDLTDLEFNIKESAMVNKNILYSTWHEKYFKLILTFQTAVSPDDKLIMDAIIASHV